MRYTSWCLLLVVGVAAANDDIIVTQARDARVTDENEVLVPGKGVTVAMDKNALKPKVRERETFLANSRWTWQLFSHCRTRSAGRG